MKTIRDAVHGDMVFDDLELGMIDTRTFQRLRGIKQLGTSNLVFPSAVHTRFEHSLGVCWLTKRILDRLARQGHGIDYRLAKAIRAASLLHDITHVPFGHTFEDERRLFDRHDEDTTRLDYFLDQPDLARVLSREGIADDVRSILLKSQSEPSLGQQLVVGTIAPDLLDYLRRDAFFCGLRLEYDDRLFQLFDISAGALVLKLHKKGTIRRDALSEIIHLLQMRYSLTERVYFHHAKIASGAMISKSLELALEAEVIRRQDLFHWRDDVLLDRLEQAGQTQTHLGDIMGDLLARRLYVPVYSLTLAGLGRPGIDFSQRDELASRYHADPTARRTGEQQLAGQLGVPESHVIIYCPSPRMSLKEANVAVETGPGCLSRLSDLHHPDVEALTQKHLHIWRFFVLVRKTLGVKNERATTCCEEYFGIPNHGYPATV
jgi:hypothetical protein